MDLDGLTEEELIEKRKAFRAGTVEYEQIKNRLGTLRRNKEVRSASRRKSYVEEVERSGKPTPKKYGKPKEEEQPNFIDHEAMSKDYITHRFLYKTLEIQPRRYKKIACRVYGGAPLETLSIIPNKEYMEANYPGLVIKEGVGVVEGGMLECTWYNHNDRNQEQLTIKELNELVTVVGLGFSSPKDKDPKFSHSDAKQAHSLMFRYKNGTVIVTIHYVYKDPETDLNMRALAGVMLFSKDVTTFRHHKSNGTKTQVYGNKLSVCNLAIFTILKEYRQRGLGLIVMQAMEGVMQEEGVDLVIWCGCNRRFYKICGSDQAPEFMDCPFQIVADETINRSMFFIKAIRRQGQLKFQDAVVDPWSKDRKNITFSFEFKNETLKEYYGLPYDENPNEPEELAGEVEEVAEADEETVPEIVWEILEYKVAETSTETIIDVPLGDYMEAYLKDPKALQNHCSGDGKSLVISGTRPGHQFEINIMYDQPNVITKGTVKGDFFEENWLRITITTEFTCSDSPSPFVG